MTTSTEGAPAGTGGGTGAGTATGEGQQGQQQGGTGAGTATGGNGQQDGTPDLAPWADLVKAWAAEGLDPAKVADKLKHARTWEDRSKANRDELERLKREGMKPDERQAAEARDALRAELMQSLAPELAGAAIVKAAAGKVDPAALDSAMGLMDMTRFIGSDGKVDTAKVNEAVETLAKLSPATPAGQQQTQVPVVQGAQGGGRPAQLTRADLSRMTDAEIDKARKDGRLDDLLGIKRP